MNCTYRDNIRKASLDAIRRCQVGYALIVSGWGANYYCSPDSADDYFKLVGYTKKFLFEHPTDAMLDFMTVEEFEKAYEDASELATQLEECFEKLFTPTNLRSSRFHRYSQPNRNGDSFFEPGYVYAPYQPIFFSGLAIKRYAQTQINKSYYGRIKI
jgi:hypothetical protein